MRCIDLPYCATYLTGHVRIPVLPKVPPGLHFLREEVGIQGPDWKMLGGSDSGWANLANLWLRAETAVGKAGAAPLNADEISESPLPNEWKAWLLHQVNPANGRLLPEKSFDICLTEYLRGLNWMQLESDLDHVLSYPWARSGKTGLIGLLLVLNWQAIYSGTGKAWMDNVALVTKLFQAIIDAPTL